jgi:RNA polymerase-binding transcription factor DksA
MPAMTTRQRRAVHGAVRDELARVEAQVAALSRSLVDIIDAAVMSNVDDEHDPEGSTIAFERAQVTALLRQARADAADLRATLERVDEDGYGSCAHCHEFIGVERLLALPAATRCIRCAT